jgi:hypothetical protein
MEKPMRNLILAGVAAMALATFPALAQDNSADTPPADQAAPAAQPADQAPPPVQSADDANAQAAPAPPTTTVETDAATGAGAVVTTYPGNVAAPPPANKAYPVCSRKVQDECQNPGEGGAPGRSRALHYWPGKPASEL